MKVLLGCESSGRIRDEFIRLGHDAWSCDLLPTEAPGPHLQCDIRTVLDRDWHLLIVHPDCTFLTVSNTYILRGCSKYTSEQAIEYREQAVRFFMLFADCGIDKVCIENPIGIMSTRWRKPDQIIQPYQFGEDASKATCLWLKNLPPLRPTEYVEPRIVNGKKRWANQTDGGQNRLPPSKDRWKIRARTYRGIARAMAQQWSDEEPSLFNGA